MQWVLSLNQSLPPPLTCPALPHWDGDIKVEQTLWNFTWLGIKEIKLGTGWRLQTHNFYRISTKEILFKTSDNLKGCFHSVPRDSNVRGPIKFTWNPSYGSHSGELGSDGRFYYGRQSVPLDQLASRLSTTYSHSSKITNSLHTSALLVNSTEGAPLVW